MLIISIEGFNLNIDEDSQVASKKAKNPVGGHTIIETSCKPSILIIWDLTVAKRPGVQM